MGVASSVAALCSGVLRLLQQLSGVGLNLRLVHDSGSVKLGHMHTLDVVKTYKCAREWTNWLPWQLENNL